MQKEIIIRIPFDKSNTALDLHTLFTALPTIFREHVCEECNWSHPTFYRKIKKGDTPDPNNRTRAISTISKAENAKIIEIGISLFEKAGIHIARYDQNNTTNDNKQY